MRTAAGLACVALLVACAPTLQHPVPGGPKFQSDEVRFVAPTGWEVQQPTTGWPDLDQIVAYLANQPLDEDCREAGTEISCGSPLTGGLRAGGMLVVWAGQPCVAQSCALPSETLIAVGNRQGVRTPTDVGCEGTGFTERCGLLRDGDPAAGGHPAGLRTRPERRLAVGVPRLPGCHPVADSVKAGALYSIDT